jgi:hypothetical protein
LKWSAFGRVLVILSLFGLVFAFGGGLVGLALGRFMPGYYRGIVSGGRMPDFNPTDVGIGLGSSQGIMVGVVVGGLVAMALAWKRRRSGELSTMSPSVSRSAGA